MDQIKQDLNEFYSKKFTFMENLVKENEVLKDRVKDLEKQVEDLSSYSRRNNVVVYGIPIQTDEKPLDLAVEICNVAEVKIMHREIDTAHRLPSRASNGTPPPFIIKLMKCFIKEELIHKIKK